MQFIVIGRVAVRGLPARSSRAAGRGDGQSRRADRLTTCGSSRSCGRRNGTGHRRRMSCRDSWRAGSARRSSTARRSRSASSAATRSSSAGWRRRWSSWPTTCRRVRTPSVEELARLVFDAIPRGSRSLVAVPSGTCTFPRTAVAIMRSRTPRVRLSSSAVRPADAPALSAVGDAFMFQEYYADRTPEQVAAIFGSHFAEAVRQLPVGTWQGPIESGLGWHLVLVTSGDARSRPGLRGDRGRDPGGVDGGSRGQQARRRAFDAMKARYEVRLPALSRVHNETLRTGCLRRRHERSIASHSRIRSDAVAAGAGIWCCSLDARHASAHEARPAYLALTETAPDRFDVVWRTPVVSGMRLPVVLQLPGWRHQHHRAELARAARFGRRA